MSKVIFIVFGLGVVLGFIWRGRVTVLSALGSAVGLMAAVLTGFWSSLPPSFARLESLPHYLFALAGYLAAFVAPTVFGALAGFGLRTFGRRFFRRDAT